MHIVKEGEAEVYTYSSKPTGKDRHSQGPCPTKKMTVFYNPVMEKQRDITICSLIVFQKMVGKRLDIADPMAGSGVRGIRICKEVSGIGKLALNDVSTDAFDLIKRNVKLNKSLSPSFQNRVPKPQERKGYSTQKKTTTHANIEVYKKDARIFLLESRAGFDYVDIDPFGSPIKYLEPSAYSLRHNSMFAATATDTGALAGSFSKTCLRRYGIRVCKTDFYKEVGIRALITSIQLAFGKYNAAFKPLLSFSNHYFRVFGLVEKNKCKTDRNFEKIGFASYCRNCLWRKPELLHICPNCKSKLDILGPIWLGQIQDNKFVKDVCMEGEKRDFKFKFQEEVDSTFYYDLAEVCKKYKLQPAKIDNIVNGLKKHGFQASRSSLYPTGIKTDAEIRDLVKFLKN